MFSINSKEAAQRLADFDIWYETHKPKATNLNELWYYVKRQCRQRKKIKLRLYLLAKIKG